MFSTFKQYLVEVADDDDDTNPEAVNVPSILRTGINKMLRMSYISDDPAERERDMKDVLDAFDIMEGLEILRRFFHDTKPEIVQTNRGTRDTSKPMRQGEDSFDFIKDVKDAVEDFYLKARDEKASVLKRRKYNALYRLVLEPIIDSFKKYSHEDALINIDSMVDNAMRYIKTSDIVPEADKAFQLRRDIRREITRAQNIKRAAAAIAKMREPKRLKKEASITKKAKAALKPKKNRRKQK